MPPLARAARHAAELSSADGRSPDTSGAEATVAPLVERLDAAEDAGDVDARQLADLLGVTAGALRPALARPAAFTAEQAALVARTLGVDAAAMRALRRAGADAGPPAGEAPAGGPAGSPGVTPHAASAGPPGSMPVLLDGVLRAVRPDPTGVALRGAVLDVCEAAARAAGRALPPAVHALRAALAGPAAGEHGAPGAAPPHDAEQRPAADAAADAGAGADAELVARAAAVVRELQRTAPGYDDLFAPLHDDALADLLARHALAVYPAPGVAAGTRFVLTPVLLGRRRLVLAAAASADQRRLVVRAALAHCAAGHGGEHAPLASPAPEPAARLADLVALADLVPFWQVADLRRRGRMGWGALGEHVGGVARRLAGDWAAARALDRGRLRVALFRREGL